MTIFTEQRILIALQVLQLALTDLAQWATAKIDFLPPVTDSVIIQAKSLLDWPESKTDFYPLKLLFGQIALSDSSQRQKTLYWPAIALADQDPIIPEPVEIVDSQALNLLKQEICAGLQNITSEDWKNLSFLGIFLEKYTSHLSLGESDIAYFDLVKMTAAVASAIIPTPEAENLCLVGADLSGIQDFIYTITSDGALKSLRARSFYLEIVIEEVIQQLLNKLHLPRTSIIYSGGGTIYLLAPDAADTPNILSILRRNFNEWLFNEFQGKGSLTLACHSFSKADVGNSNISTVWNHFKQQLSIQKNRKFDDLIDKALEIEDSYTPCKVCGRDNIKRLRQLGKKNGLAESCATCSRMFRLGGQLFHVKAIVRSQKRPIAKQYLGFNSPSGLVYYNLFDFVEDAFEVAGLNQIFLINNWNIHQYKISNTIPLLLGNYGKRSGIEGEESAFISAQEMVEAAKGIPRVGYLRMDVDRLGKIFTEGLGKHQNLPRLAGLSRQMSYFFKVYLNSLAEYRDQNFWQPLQTQHFRTVSTQPDDEKSDRKDLLFIYSGGDDVFVSGAWNQIVEFSFDVYQAFRAFTGQHPDITLSAGISIHPAKYPLYQAAEQSGQAEGAAKGAGRDRLSLFGEVFQWNEWLGQPDQVHFTAEDKAYLQDESIPKLFGVLPFVQQLSTNLNQSYSRSFVHHLLITAQIQKRMVKEAQEKNLSQIKDTQYFLHLPRVAYTLARLPSEIAKSDIGTSLKSPRNARYFYAIATWISLLTRQTRPDRTLNNTNHDKSTQQPT
jgi:CRISPR-associated protein Csm1